MKDFLKNWKTNLLAIIILAGTLYEGLTDGFSIKEAISGLTSLGLFATKEYNITHTEKE